jgi:hypothetical protein
LPIGKITFLLMDICFGVSLLYTWHCLNIFSSLITIAFPPTACVSGASLRARVRRVLIGNIEGPRIQPLEPPVTALVQLKYNSQRGIDSFNLIRAQFTSNSH